MTSSSVYFGIPICPITQEPMVEPVIDPEGNSYEKSAIMEWVSQHHDSPITRSQLNESDLAPNRALIELIEAMSKTTIAKSNSNTMRQCAKCNKPISVSNKYKGKKAPICFKCRPWNCSQCTYSNDSNLTKCEMCDYSRF